MVFHSRPLFLVHLLIALLAAVAGHAAELVVPDVIYPAIPSSAVNLEGFTPPDWLVEATTEHDLNGDGFPDLVIVLHGAWQGNVVTDPNGQRGQSLNTNPRMLVVAFAEAGPGPKSYRQVLVDRTIIPRWTDPSLDDPFGELTAARGSFSIRLQFFAFEGAWEAISSNLTFRHQKGRFELIGATRDSVHRATGEMKGVSANYSTGYKILTSGRIENDVMTSTRRRLEKPSRLGLHEVGDGLAFEPR